MATPEAPPTNPLVGYDDTNDRFRYVALDGDGKVLTSGGGGGGGGGASTIADGADVALGATSDAAAASDDATASLIALFKRLLQHLSTLIAGVTLNAQAITSSTVTIANGTSLSDAVDLSGRGLVRILMPAAWDAASLTFQVSQDGSTYYNLYSDSAEYTVSAAAASRSIIVFPGDFIGLRYLKVRSGTSGAAVNQGGSRSIVLLTRPLA